MEVQGWIVRGTQEDCERNLPTLSSNCPGSTLRKLTVPLPQPASCLSSVPFSGSSPYVPFRSKARFVWLFCPFPVRVCELSNPRACCRCCGHSYFFPTDLQCNILCLHRVLQGGDPARDRNEILEVIPLISLLHKFEGMDSPSCCALHCHVTGLVLEGNTVLMFGGWFFSVTRRELSFSDTRLLLVHHCLCCSVTEVLDSHIWCIGLFKELV